MLRIAIVGTGWWGKELARAAAALPDRISLAGCATLSAEEGAAFQAEFGGRVYPDAAAVFADADVDAALFATPHSLHAAQAIDAARAGKHLFIEKPMTLSVADGRAMIAAAERAGVVLAVGHNRRFCEVAGIIRDRMAAGEFGRILHVEASYSGNGALLMKPEQWRAQRREAPCAGLTPMGLHMVDTIRWLLGPVRRVAAIAKRQATSLDIDDTCAVLFELEGGQTGFLGTHMAVPPGSHFRLEGTKARVLANNNFAELSVLAMGAGAPAVSQHRPADGSTLVAELAAFAGACSGGATYPVSPAEALHNVAFVEAARRSAEADGAWIALGSL